jgi:hypothetical protein
MHHAKRPMERRSTTFLPKSSGGGHDLANLRLSHKYCNEMRGHLTALINGGGILMLADFQPHVRQEIQQLLDAEARRRLAVRMNETGAVKPTDTEEAK